MIEPLIEPVTFEPGDVVALKSGGPAMTVVGVKEDRPALLVVCGGGRRGKNGCRPRDLR